MVTKFQRTISPHGTEHPLQYDIPHVHHDISNSTQDNPHSTHDIPHGTEHPQGTQDIPHSTEHPHSTAHTLYRVLRLDSHQFTILYSMLQIAM